MYQYLKICGFYVETTAYIDNVFDKTVICVYNIE